MATEFGKRLGRLIDNDLYVIYIMVIYIRTPLIVLVALTIVLHAFLATMGGESCLKYTS